MAEVKSKPGKRLRYRRALILLAIALSVLAGNAIFGEGGLREGDVARLCRLARVRRVDLPPCTRTHTPFQ